VPWRTTVNGWFGGLVDAMAGQRVAARQSGTALLDEALLDGDRIGGIINW